MSTLWLKFAIAAMGLFKAVIAPFLAYRAGKKAAQEKVLQQEIRDVRKKAQDLANRPRSRDDFSFRVRAAAARKRRNKT